MFAMNVLNFVQVAGSVVDNTLYPGVAALDPRDFMHQGNCNPFTILYVH